MASPVNDVKPFPQVHASLSELAEQSAERERIHRLLIDDARRGLDDIRAGRTQDADATLKARQSQQAAKSKKAAHG